MSLMETLKERNKYVTHLRWMFIAKYWVELFVFVYLLTKGYWLALGIFFLWFILNSFMMFKQVQKLEEKSRLN